MRNKSEARNQKSYHTSFLYRNSNSPYQLLFVCVLWQIDKISLIVLLPHTTKKTDFRIAYYFMLLACPAVSVSVVRIAYNFMLLACPAVSVSVIRISYNFMLLACPVVSVSVVRIGYYFMPFGLPRCIRFNSQDIL